MHLMTTPSIINAALISLLVLATAACGDTPPPVNDDVPSPGEVTSTPEMVADSVCLCVQRVLTYKTVAGTEIDDASMQEIDIVSESIRALDCVAALEQQYGSLRKSQERRSDISDALQAQCADAIEILDEL